ncbi:MAG: hypothetical protein ABWK53_04305 [Anaerolineales bacterium]
MLDNLRDQAAQSEYFQEEAIPAFEEPAVVRRSAARRSLDQVTGMNAQQRFLLAFMLLILVCMLGTMFLLITGKIVPPFL